MVFNLYNGLYVTRRDLREDMRNKSFVIRRYLCSIYPADLESQPFYRFSTNSYVPHYNPVQVLNQLYTLCKLRMDIHDRLHIGGEFSCVGEAKRADIHKV